MNCIKQCLNVKKYKWSVRTENVSCCYAAHMEHCLMFTFPAVSPAHMYLLVPLKIAQPGSGISTCGKYEKFCLFHNSINIHVHLAYCVKIMKYLKVFFFYKILNENKSTCEGKKMKTFCLIITLEKKNSHERVFSCRLLREKILSSTCKNVPIS